MNIVNDLFKQKYEWEWLNNSQSIYGTVVDGPKW